MKKLIALLVAVGMFVALGSFAATTKKPSSQNKPATQTPPAKESPPKVKELELKGKITKSQDPSKDKQATYSISTSQYGSLDLPDGKNVKLDEFADKDVVVKAKVELKEKSGSKSYKVKEIESVKAADDKATPADAKAAPKTTK